VATSTFFPTISLTGGLGTASNSLNNLFNASNNFWQAQINAMMPILNLSVFGQIKAAKGAYYAAYYNYINAVRNAFAQVDNGLEGHQKIRESYKSQETLYNSTKLAYDLGNDRYTDGADSYITMLQYKIKYDNAAITLSQVKLQELQSIVNLYQVLAGGYSVENTAEPKKFGDSHDS
jgi:multidrug efflux system outer membrane protein